MKKKISIIGTGKIAKFHVPALKKAGFEIISCCALPNSERAKIFATQNCIKKVYYNLEELLIEHEKSDCFLIATTTSSTLEVLKECLKINKPILVEKPITHNKFDFNKLIKFDTKKVLVGYNRRFYSTIDHAKNFIEKNNPCLLNIELPDKFENFMEYSVHGLDLINYLLPNIYLEKIEVYQQPNNMIGKIAMFKNLRGDRCFAKFNWNMPANYSLTIDAFPYRLELKPLEELRIFSGMKICSANKNHPIRKYVPKLIKKENIFKYSKEFKPGFLEQAKEFYNIVNNKCSNKGANLKHAKIAIEWANKIIDKN